MSEAVVVWIDHREARLFRLGESGAAAETVRAPLANTHHKHPRGAGEPREHPDDRKRFFRDVASALSGSRAVLLVGPSSAKLELVEWVRAHDPTLARSIVGVETLDHPSPRQVIAHGKAFFEKAAARR